MARNVDLARENQGPLEAAFQHRCSEAELGGKDWIFRSFADYVGNNKKLAVNIEPPILLKLLTPNPDPTRASPWERYKNRHTLVAEGILPDDQAYKRRLDMEDLLGFGSEKADIYYVNLNTGNEGIRRYGKYCLLLKTSLNLVNNVSFLANDSYSYLFSYYGTARRPFSIDRATWHDVHKLVAVKHFDVVMSRMQPLSTAEIDNCVLDANRPDFSEGHLYIAASAVPGGFTIQDVEEVRISSDDMTRFLFLHTKNFVAGISNKSEFSEYWTDKEIIASLEANNIKLTVI